MSDEIADAAGTEYPLVHLLTTTGWRHLPYLVVSSIAMIVSTILDRADVFVLGLAFDAMFNDQSYVLPLLPDSWIPTEPENQLLFTVGLLLAMKVTDVAAANLSQFAGGIYTQRMLHDVRVEAFDATQRLELGFFEGSLTGEVMSVLNDDVNTLQTFLDRGIVLTLRVVFVLATVMALMFVLNWQLALFVLLAAPVIALVNWWFSIVLERLHDVVRSSVGHLNARLETNLGGIAVIKAYTAETFESGRVSSASYDHYEAQWDTERIAARHRPSMQFISGTSLVLTFVVGAYWIVVEPPPLFSGTLTGGQLIPFLFYLQALTWPMQGVADVIASYKQGKAAAKRIVGLQAVAETIDDGDDALESVSGRVEFDDVTFAYPGGDDPVVDGVSFVVEPGETVGLVGSTGAGKSTLVKLLLRFYDVDEGAVRVDGQNLRTITRRSLRDSIGYVDQDPFLFNATVHESVAYGASGADRSAVERAAREAGAHGFVTRLPDGYDTVVGERGVKLSGGQRQRIAIARAIVGDPSILVFDEATSHVDTETEALIQANLDDLTADRTTFVIAHRLSTVRDADRILVLDAGRIVEEGAHDELLAADGVYADLWRVQVGDVDSLPAGFVADVTATLREGDE